MNQDEEIAKIIMDPGEGMPSRPDSTSQGSSIMERRTLTSPTFSSEESNSSSNSSQNSGAVMSTSPHFHRHDDDDKNNNQDVPYVPTIKAGAMFQQHQLKKKSFFALNKNREENLHDQLPSVEEARMYAMAVNNKNKGKKGILKQLSFNNNKNHKNGYHHPSTQMNNSTQIAYGNQDETQRQQHDNNNNNDENKKTLGSSCSRAGCFIFLALIGCGLILVTVVAIAASTHQRRRRESGGGSINNNNQQQPNVPSSPRQPNISQPKGPPSERLQSVVNFLVQANISTAFDLGLEDENNQQLEDTVHYAAARFMADQDVLEYTIPPINAATDDVWERFVQRYVLALFYYSLEGWNWHSSLNFLKEGLDECAWFETTLDGPQEEGGDEAFAVGVSCTPLEQVESILIPWNNLNGTLPTELALLTHLKILDLNRNFIHGAIPSEMGSALSLLEFVDLRVNELSGTLPDFTFPGDKELQVLALGDNFLQGTIPKSYAALTKLKTLELEHNELGGDLSLFESDGDNNPDIPALSHLEFVLMQNNFFRHTVTHNFLAASPHLIEVDVSRNSLEGHVGIPPHFFALSQLQVLDMSVNSIFGPLPSLQDLLRHIAQNDSGMTSLEYLSLEDNLLTGTISSDIVDWSYLQHLDLGYNFFAGSLPDFITSQNLIEPDNDNTTNNRDQNLHYLSLSHNQFTPGPLPSLIQFSNLEVLGLAKIQRTGTIPAHWLGSFPYIQLLDVSQNQLQGSLPEGFFRDGATLYDLQYLFLHDNQLTGTFPTPLLEEQGAVWKLPTFLFLDRNSFSTGMRDLCQAHNALDAIETQSNNNDNYVWTADCDEVEGGCPCCSQCCTDEDPVSCQAVVDAEYNRIMRGAWEHNYTLFDYAVAPDILEQEFEN